jgi:ankyrin repeat protein
MEIRTAIETGDAAALRQAIAEDPARANALIEWGDKCEIRTHPLHYVSDMLFGGTLARGKGLPLIDALLAGGSDVNFAAASGETALIGAASLLAEDVGLRLVEAGADVKARGLFKETALHWAAHVGLPRLVEALIARGADVNLRDERYEATPLVWALHGYFTSNETEAKHRETVAALVKGGATVEPRMLEEAQRDPAMLAALTGR